MKFSSKIQRCELSPMRKFLPYELAAEAKGRKIYHLNIGQPDIETPKAFFDAVKNFQDPVLAYAAAPGVSEFLTAVQGYYANLGIHLEQSDIYATAGGSEALQMALTCILDEGDEILIPEPFYPNYNTFVSVTGGVIRPIPTTPEEGYRYADRARIEPLINTGHPGDQPRQPHRRGPLPGGDAPDGGHRQRARPVPYQRRGVPGVRLRRRASGLHGPV